ncbi:MAG: 4-carboxymuconolactone decarboxylase, partial [Peptostreptococcaceae bacterium]|nr:4-carboxymuconolactone decarboxylase [Peptostreptococcaceae bacterium]
MVFFILLPLENQCEIEDSERYEKGFGIQYPIYGGEIKDKYSSLPDEVSKALPRFLTEFCFG